MGFDIGLFWKYRAFVSAGLATTIGLALASQALALAIAVPTAVARMSRARLLRGLSGAYVEIVRGTPFLTQLFWIFYCVPIFLGFGWSPLTGAVFALALNVGAYDAEVFRAGIESVHAGQWQAARALGMSWSRTFVSVILPQATRYVLPALLNNFIGLLLISSIASTIGVQDLTYVAGKLNVATFQSILVFTGVGAIYLALTVITSVGVRRLEQAQAERE